MAEYIDRKSLIEHLNQFAPKFYSRAVDLVIEKEPVADVAPVRREHWERYRDIVQCSGCYFGMFPIPYVFEECDCKGTNVIPKYCPNCGAKMED